MTTSNDPDASSAWDPSSPQVCVDRSERPFPFVQVRHLNLPFTIELRRQSYQIAEYLPLVYRYLALVRNRLEIDVRLLDGLDPANQNSVGLTLKWLIDPSLPRHSYWMNRTNAVGGPAAVNRTLVLLACLSGSDGLPLHGGQGIRIIAHVLDRPGNAVIVRITGAVSTIPALLASGTAFTAKIFSPAFRDDLKLFAMRGLPPENVPVDEGLAFFPETGLASKMPMPMVYWFSTAVPQSRQLENTQLSSSSHRVTAHFAWTENQKLDIQVTLQPLIAFAQARAQVMKRDPMTQRGSSDFWKARPHQPSEELAALREITQWSTPTGGPGHPVELSDADVRVRHCRLVDPPNTEDTPKLVPEQSDAVVRSNEFAAVCAYYHGQSLFRRIRQYGLVPVDILRFITLPLDIHYRAGILPGFADGRVVNAQVAWTIRSTPMPAPVPPNPSPAPSQDEAPMLPQAIVQPSPLSSVDRRLEVRFALGDLSVATGRLPANELTPPAGTIAAERHPLGVSTDARWCWHEFGHVLIAGATGELELPFAHGVGDALAAILNDPGSALALAQDGAADNDCGWRHATFPWIHIPRRHDKNVQQGWSWTETVCGVGSPQGYRSEQLMSTSMFRLYRALGGDCLTRNAAGDMVPATPARGDAANYATYLIMRTLASLGPANVSPCVSVHMFVHAMRTIDCATSAMPGPGGYIGGTANKLIQWAFERQGLYGIPVPSAQIAGPEERGQRTLDVDLHIDDRRVQTDGPYTPIDLHGSDWRADPDAITVTRVDPFTHEQQSIVVTVHNRGADAAQNTVVTVWCSIVPASGRIARFPGAAWTLAGVQTGDVSGHNGTAPGHRRFPAMAWSPPQSGRYAVLVSASCPADNSNIDPATGFPCVTEPGPIERLVAFDNNLGLAIVTV